MESVLLHWWQLHQKYFTVLGPRLQDAKVKLESLKQNYIKNWTVKTSYDPDKFLS